MTRVRRSGHLFFRIEDVTVPDPAAFLRGRFTPLTLPGIRCLSLVTLQEGGVTALELALLAAVRADEWTPVDEILTVHGTTEAAVLDLVDRGLLLSDLDRYAEALEKERLLDAAGWAPFASAFHYTGRWEGHRGLESSPGSMEELLQLIAAQDRSHAESLDVAPEPPFPEARAGNEEIHLHVPDGSSDWASHPLLDVLRSRRTLREFEADTMLTSTQLSDILHTVWGCQGVAGVGPAALVKKTSPSAGALHPTEVYPLVLRVEGLEAGIYRYCSDRHCLERIRPLASERAQDMADRLTAGQYYPRGASALFILTSRFRRNFWKYQNHAKAYRAVILDVGHLSQTFYLVCTAMGLGPFFTSAINEVDVERELGLDPLLEGALGICGCGVPVPRAKFVLDARPAGVLRS